MCALEYKDVHYFEGGGAEQTLDLFIEQPNVPEKTRVLVYVHGGAWKSGDKSEFKNTAKRLIQKNKDDGRPDADRFYIAVCAVNYRLCSASNSIKYPDQLIDIYRALKYIVAFGSRFQYNQSQLYLCGWSAGAHLLSMLTLKVNTEWFRTIKFFADDQRNSKMKANIMTNKITEKKYQQLEDNIRGVICIGGIYNLPNLIKMWPTYKDFVEIAFGPSPGNWKKCSAMYIPRRLKTLEAKDEFYISEQMDTKYLIIHSTEDDLVDLIQSSDYASFLNMELENVEKVIESLGDHEKQLECDRTLFHIYNFISK